MENIFKGHANDGGVYRILNKKNGRVYYGSAARFKQRSREHLSALKKGTHHNLFLQRDFNKCGKDAFQYEVVKVVKLPTSGDKDEWSLLRVTEEQKYIDEAFDNRNMCYNGTKYAVDIGYHPWKEDRKEKMSKIMTKIYSDPSLREKAKDYAHKRWNAHSANVTVSNKETGETATIEGSVRAWCEARNLSYKSFHLMLKGKTKSSSGWFFGTEAPTYVERKGEKRKPMSKEGKAARASSQWEGIVVENFVTKQQIVLGKNIKEDCNDSLNYHALRRLLQGVNLITSSGWFLKEKEDNAKQQVVDVCKECCLVFGSKSGMKNHKRRHK